VKKKLFFRIEKKIPEENRKVQEEIFLSEQQLAGVSVGNTNHHHLHHHH
jgi:hypothetical protein